MDDIWVVYKNNMSLLLYPLPSELQFEFKYTMYPWSLQKNQLSGTVVILTQFDQNDLPRILLKLVYTQAV